MRRDFIIVVGNQGAGKSVWAKIYAQTIPRLLVYDPLASYRVDFTTDPEDYISDIADGNTSSFRVGTYLQDELSLFGSAAFAAGNCTMVMEECGVVFQRGTLMEQWLSRLIFMGRHRSVSLVYVAQRAASIPIDVRSQASRIVSFRQSEPEDVDALCKRIGKQYRDVIPQLPDLECVDWEGGHVKQYKVRPPY